MRATAFAGSGPAAPLSDPAQVSLRDGTSRRPRSRMSPRDVLASGAVGVRTRPLRSTLTALGIAIGIAALVATLGISASSRADLVAQLDRLGTNRLEVRPGQSFTGTAAQLPETSVAMVRRIGPVVAASGVASVSATVRRSDLVPEAETGGIGVLAAEGSLLDAVDGTVREGRFLDGAIDGYPAVVLGATAAERLGIRDLAPRPRLYLSGHWFTVVGILDHVPLLAGLDSSAFIGADIAEELFGTERAPTAIYVKTTPEQVEAVHRVLASTANPQAPNEVQVSRPSDAVQARAAVDDTMRALLLGLGAVALLVGGIGIANVMVIGVLERRAEIGVRRALGATRRHVRLQFLTEAVLLALLGGAGGAALGAAVTVGYAAVRDLTVSLPLGALAAGIGAALVVGTLAGLSPAARAARLAPADALRPA